MSTVSGLQEAAPADSAFSVVARVLQDVRSDPALLSAAAHAARGAVPGAGKALPHDEIRRHIDVQLDALLALVVGGPDDERAMAAAADLATDQAEQGMSLASLLAGFQAARSLLLSSLLAHLGDAAGPAGLVPLLTHLDDAAGSLQTRMILAHQAAEKSLGRLRSAVRVEALRALLGRGDAAAARDLDLDPERRLHCLVTAVSAPREAREVEALLATRDGAAGIVHGYLCKVTSQLPREPARLDGVLVVASPLVSVADMPAAHAFCRSAVEIGRARGDLGLRAMTDYALEIAMVGRQDLAQHVVGALLADLDPADAFHRQVVETGFAYLGHGRRVDATATALHVHPNTVAHRLRRLHELSGFAAVQEGENAFVTTGRWWWAMRTWLAGPG